MVAYREVEDDSSRDQGHPRVGGFQATALLLQIADHAIGCGEAKGRAAAQHDPVNLRHRREGREDIRLARAGRLPLTSTEPVHPLGASTTVQPVPRSRSV